VDLEQVKEQLERSQPCHASSAKLMAMVSADPSPPPLQIQSSAMIQQLAIGFCLLVFILNSFSVLVTFMLSSVWHAILDNFRPITI